LDQFFKKTGADYSRYNYLGEWHSHPRFPVKPSLQDCRSMMDMVGNEASIPFSALLIVRLDFLFFLKLGATMFSKHRPPEMIKVERP